MLKLDWNALRRWPSLFQQVLRVPHSSSKFWVPARQLECGQQKGGNFYCSGCGANAQRVYELDYCFRCLYISLKDRQQLIMAGPIGRENSLLKANKPLKKLSKDQLTRELNSRKIYGGNTKKELEQLLAEEMHGVQRVPALLYTNSTCTLETIKCAHYEVLTFEPLHDIGKHIENVITELPSHLPNKEANAIQELIHLSIGSKATQRTCDYRRALVMLAKHSSSIISRNVQQLLQSLVEIQRIAYSSEKDRTSKSILRFHNITWFHGILCREVFGFNLKKLMARKLYGNYYHNITCHAAMQHRLISGKSCNVEEQEMVFNTITSITKSTSSYHPDHIIGNIFIRLQAEKQNEFTCSSISQQESTVSKLAASLPLWGNTIIPHQIIKKFQRSWQAQARILHGST